MDLTGGAVRQVGKERLPQEASARLGEAGGGMARQRPLHFGIRGRARGLAVLRFGLEGGGL